MDLISEAKKYKQDLKDLIQHATGKIKVLKYHAHLIHKDRHESHIHITDNLPAIPEVTLGGSL